jgi:hypothetical protein
VIVDGVIGGGPWGRERVQGRWENGPIWHRYESTPEPSPTRWVIDPVGSGSPLVVGVSFIAPVPVLWEPSPIDLVVSYASYRSRLPRALAYQYFSGRVSHWALRRIKVYTTYHRCEIATFNVLYLG